MWFSIGQNSIQTTFHAVNLPIGQLIIRWKFRRGQFSVGQNKFSEWAIFRVGQFSVVYFPIGQSKIVGQYSGHLNPYSGFTFQVQLLRSLHVYAISEVNAYTLVLVFMHKACSLRVVRKHYSKLYYRDSRHKVIFQISTL